MFNLLDRVTDGIQPMLSALEDYIITAGLADMKASADTITTVSDTSRTVSRSMVDNVDVLGVRI